MIYNSSIYWPSKHRSGWFETGIWTYWITLRDLPYQTVPHQLLKIGAFESLLKLWTTKKKLTWSCLTCGLRHLLAGITSTFMIWILEPRARCLAAISRSANKNQPIIYTYVTSYSRCFHIELSELYTTPQPCDHRTLEYDLFPKLGLHWRRFSRLVENLEHFDVACILQITCRCANPN